MKATIILFFTFLFILKVFSKTAEEWKSRSVYQIITDRFAKSDGSIDSCQDLGNYCGGTFKGIENNLDYIQGMGFNAIWISPIVANNPGGYHGYWTSNLYEINENFGTPQELHELIQACHDRDIWVMVDVVANHVGYVDNLDFSSIVPFNNIEYYNAYKHCDNVTHGDQEGIETCWLNGLPDLDQNHPFVRDTFLTWVSDFVKQYNIDALRIDTVPHVTKDFWNEFSQAAGVFTIGEILSFDLPYIAGYQGYVDSVLNYALYSTMRYAFQNEGSMSSFESYYEGAHSTYSDVTILGNFVDNHDNPRFLSSSNNQQNFKAALAFSICSIGIPMVYYGDEQAFNGGMDPANREPLWTNMDTRTDIYHYLKTLNAFRTETKFYEYDQTQRYADTNFYAFTRGEYFFAFTNSQDTQVRSITFHPYAEGTTLCNIFHKGDCVEVKDGQFPVVLLNGEVKIFTPSIQDTQQAELPKKTWSSIKELWGSSTVFEMNSRNSFWRHTN